ncbi:MAG: carbohydrate-binding domain-containing protein [Muribaculaceae bacterium]|nr:carbohydrate-binding domain-containing protein [Muribaculaceae bacterium]
MRQFLLPKWMATGLLTLLLVMLCPLAAHAVQNINGSVKTSQLTQQYIQLTGNTTITVDKDYFIREIYCSQTIGSGEDMVVNYYDLTIILNGKKIEFNSSGDVAMYGGGTLNVYGPGYMRITGKRGTINNFSAINIEDGAEVDAEGRDTWRSNGIDCGSAFITIDNSTLNATGREAGIYCTRLTVNGNSTVTATGRGTNYANHRGEMYESVGWGIKCANMVVNGGTVSVTSKYEAGIQCSNTLTVNDGLVTVNSSLGDGDGTSLFPNQIFKGAIYTHHLDINGGKVKTDSNQDGVRLSGNLTISGGTLIGEGGKSYSGLSVAGDITASGEARIEANGSEQGIYCKGNVTLSNFLTVAKARAKSGYGIYAAKKLTINIIDQFSSVQGRADYVPIYADGGIVFPRPYGITETGVVLHSSGKSFSDGNTNKIHHGSVGIIKPYLKYWTTPPSTASGQCTDKLRYNPGTKVNFVLPQAIKNYVNYDNAQLTVWWYMQHTAGSQQFDYVGTGTSYTTMPGDDGKMMYAEFMFDTHQGSLISDNVAIGKVENTNQPMAANVSYQGNNLWVTNPRTNQEYLVLSTFKEVSSLTAGDWTAAESPTSATSAFRLTRAVSGSVNYVYTRYKETSSEKPGAIVLYTAAYRGSSTTVEDVQFKVTGVNCNVKSDCNNIYLVPLNGIVKYELLPVPATATGFNGVPGSDWMIDFVPSGYNKILYSDAACTKPIVDDEDHFYKEVYFKHTIAADPTAGNFGNYISVKWSRKQKDVIAWVSTADGNYNLWTTQVYNGYTPNGADYPALYVPAGTVSEHPVQFLPIAAAPADFPITLQNYWQDGVENTGTPATITYNASTKTVTVDATSTKAGHLGIYRIPRGEIRLYVIAPDATAIEVSPHEKVVQLGETVQLQAMVTPVNAAGNVTWTSSDTNLATVDADGKVVINQNATGMLGRTVTIKATIGELTDSALLTLDGYVYPIQVGGVTVNSLNQEDVMGDGKVSYSGGTLYLNAAKVENTSAALYYFKNDDLPMLNIEVKGQNSFKSSSNIGIYAQGDVSITGSGTLLGTGNTYGFNANGFDACIDGEVILTAEGSQNGFISKTLEVFNENAKVRAKGNGTFSMRVVESLWGEIESPAGAVRDEAGGYINDAAGNHIKGQYVVINGVPIEIDVDPGVRGDVTGDGRVDVEDVNAVINIILKTKQASDYPGQADVTGDGRVDVEDVNAIINIILKV